jgi:hypothetical protein
VNEPEQNQLDNIDHEKNHHAPHPYWKQPHIQWAFWIGVGLMGIALVVYIFSLNLAFIPHSWHQQP